MHLTLPFYSYLHSEGFYRGVCLYVIYLILCKKKYELQHPVLMYLTMEIMFFFIVNITFNSLDLTVHQ